MQQLKVLVIYTADVEWAQEVYDLGDVTLRVEASYLVRQNTDEIYERLSRKIHEEEELTAEDLAQLMILPLTVKGTDAKQVYIEKAVGLAKQLSNHEQMMRVISGILTFTDKVIDQKYAEKVRNELMMTKVERLIFEDGFEDGAVKGRTEGRTVGRSEGEFLKLIGQVQKKCLKGKSLAEIAAELEEEEADIAPIIACIREHAQFTKEEILSELHVMA